MSDLRTFEEFLKTNYVAHWNTTALEPLPYLGLTTGGVGDLMGILGGSPPSGDTLVGYGQYDYEAEHKTGKMQGFYLPPNWKMTVWNSDKSWKADFFGPTLQILDGSHPTRPLWRSASDGTLVRVTSPTSGKSLTVPVHGNVISAADALVYGPVNIHIVFVKFERQHIHRELHTKPHAPPSWYIQTVSMCLGTTFSILGTPLIRYTAHTTECDSIMTNWCNDGRLDDPDCACFKGRGALRALHGNNITLPVTCFDQGCANGGYRTADMMNQECSETICEDYVDVNGEDIQAYFGGKIYCAGKFYATKTALPVPIVNPADEVTPTPVDPADQSVPMFVWILFGLSVLIFGLLLFFVIRSTHLKK